ncbi:MAG: CYTH domain-containing protein [archaeon]
MLEKEVKILDVHPQRIRKQLEEEQAIFIKKVKQTNMLYQEKNTPLVNLAIRVRQEGKTYILTIKGPVTRTDNTKTRTEYEYPVDKSIFAALELLGLQQYSRHEVLREYYTLKKCSVEIIRSKEIPAFIEIEGAKKNINTVASILGYTPHDYFTGDVWSVYGLK